MRVHDGSTYLALLRLIHRHLSPRTYVEIGVGSGRSLARARRGTLCVGIDPAPRLRRAVPDSARVFEVTSDEFFAEHDLRAVLRGQAVDFAFIDGTHLFEFALRDFINLESACGRESLIAIHDCNPPNEEVADRQRRSAFWTGDVWKLVLCLRKYRPDLELAVVDVPPSGLGIVTRLDPASAVLRERYTEICQEYVNLAFSDLGGSKHEKLNVVPGSWESVRTMLPAPQPRATEPPPAAPRRLGVPPPRLPAPEPDRSRRLQKGPARARLATQHTLQVGDGISTEITLCGYPEPLFEQVRQSARQLDIRSDLPAIHRFQNLTFYPKFAALYDEAGRRVDEACVRRGPGLKEVQHRPPEEMAIPARAPRIDHPVIYCGRLRAHWGHFLTETISRLWALSSADVPADAALLFHGRRTRGADFVDRFFHCASIDRRRFLDLDSVTTLSEVFVPHPSFSLGGQSFSCHRELPERVAEAVCDEDPPPTDRPVYLSRRLTANRQPQRIAGEKRLEDELERLGVSVISPERLGYEEQVRMVNRHSTFIGCIGSAFHSLLYALPDRACRTAVIANAFSYHEPGYHPDYFMIDALKGIRASYLFDPTDSEEWSPDPIVNSDAAIACLKRLSLI
jgi:capsular polysaccharide biosynthesis protein